MSTRKRRLGISIATVLASTMLALSWGLGYVAGECLIRCDEEVHCHGYLEKGGGGTIVTKYRAFYDQMGKKVTCPNIYNTDKGTPDTIGVLKLNVKQKPSMGSDVCPPINQDPSGKLDPIPQIRGKATCTNPGTAKDFTCFAKCQKPPSE